MSKRLSQHELHELFLQDVREYVVSSADTGRKPLRIQLDYPYNRDLNAYIFNCTAPPGGRSIDEFKVQLILDGQRRGERGKFDLFDGRTTLIIGYAAPFVDVKAGLWVLFELDKHQEFAYSANIQVYLRQLLRALEQDVYVCVKHNKETLVISQRQYADILEGVKEQPTIPYDMKWNPDCEDCLPERIEDCIDCHKRQEGL